MATAREVLIGVDLPLEQVAAAVARVLGARPVPSPGDVEIRTAAALIGVLTPEPDGSYAFDVHGRTTADATAAAQAAFDALAAGTPWALALGEDDDSVPTVTRAALTTA